MKLQSLLFPHASLLRWLHSLKNIDMLKTREIACKKSRMHAQDFCFVSLDFSMIWISLSIHFSFQMVKICLWTKKLNLSLSVANNIVIYCYHAFTSFPMQQFAHRATLKILFKKLINKLSKQLFQTSRLSVHLSIYLPSAVCHTNIQFQQSYHKMSLIKVAWYVLRVKDIYSGSPSDPLGPRD